MKFLYQIVLPPEVLLSYSSTRSNPLNVFLTSTAKSQGTWFKSYLNGLLVFPTFFNLSLNLAIIWATVSSGSCFCWLYRPSPSLAAKNIINLISVLTVWWCPCVESSLMLLEEGVCYDQFIFWENSVSLCSASFCTSRPNLSVTPGISWLPTFAFQSPMMKRTSFLGVLEGLVGLHRTIQLQIIQHYLLGHRLGWLLYWTVSIGNEQRLFYHFWVSN